MADKRIFDLTTVKTVEDLDEHTWIWMDRKAPVGEPEEPSWKVRGDVLKQILDNFATHFVPNVRTEVGKCYWYNGLLYKCTTEYSGIWVPGNFVLTSVDELFARKDVLSALTTYAQNLAHSIATEFVPNETNAVAGKPYVYGGQLYIAREDYNGIWNANKFEKTSFDYLLKTRCPFSLSSAEFKSYKGIPAADDVTWFVSQNTRHISIPLLYGFNYVVTCTNSNQQQRFYAAILDSSYVIGDATNGASVPYASHRSGRLYKLADTAVTFAKEYDDDCYLVLPVASGDGVPFDYTISVAVKATDEILDTAASVVDEVEPISTVDSTELTQYPGSIGSTSWFLSDVNPKHTYFKLKPNRYYLVLNTTQDLRAYIAVLSARNTYQNIEAGSGDIYYSANYPERVLVSDFYLVKTDSKGSDAYLAMNAVNTAGADNSFVVHEFYSRRAALEYFNKLSEVDRFSTTTELEVVAIDSSVTKTIQIGRTIKAGSKVIVIIKGSLDVSNLASIKCDTASAGYFSRGQIAFTASRDLTSIVVTFERGFAASGTLYIHIFVNHECDVSSFRIATLNIGCMAGGEYWQPTRTEEEAAEYIAKIQTMMSTVSPDILCMQEFSLNVWDGGPNDSWKIWKNYLSFGSYVPGAGYVSKFIASMLPFALPLTAVTLDELSRNYVYMELNIRGRPVKVVSLHLNAHQPEEQQQMATIVNAFKDDKYVILCGDFNAARDYGNYAALTDAGYALANGDAFPKVYTGNRPTSDMYNDNIAVKGMRIRAVGLYADADVSDHKMMYADINFFDTGD